MSKTTRLDSLTIEGVEYVPKDQATPATNTEGLSYVVVRSATASPFAGYLFQDPNQKNYKDSGVVTLLQARRIRSWSGAMDLVQLSNEGTTKPEGCQFSAPALQVEIPFSEIHYCTTQGAQSIQAVKEWKI